MNIRITFQARRTTTALIINSDTEKEANIKGNNNLNVVNIIIAIIHIIILSIPVLPYIIRKFNFVYELDYYKYEKARFKYIKEIKFQEKFDKKANEFKE